MLRVRKRVTLAVVVVSVIFGICWITDSIVYIVSHINTDSFGAAVYSISNTMIMFNSAVNPFCLRSAKPTIQREDQEHNNL